MKNKIIILVIGIAISISVVIVFFQSFHKTMEKELAEQVVKGQVILSETGGRQIKSIFELAEMETFAMAESFPLRKLLVAIGNQDEDQIEFWKEPLTHLFKSTIASHLFFNRIQFIDSHGQEIIRVDKKDGKIYVVKVMQQKSNELYFSKSMDLEANEIYMSPIAIDKELANLETLDRDVIRLGTPIFLNKQKVGIIVTQVDMEVIYDIIFNLSNEHAWLFDVSGKLINCSMGLPQSAHDKEIELIFQQKGDSMRGIHLPLDYYHEMAERTIIAHFPIEVVNQKWYVVSELPFKEISDIMSKSDRTRDILFGIILILFMGVLIYFYKLYADQRTLQLKAELVEDLLSLNKQLQKKTKELETANLSLEEIDERKTDFLHMVAHDLRTPLTAIRSFSDLLMRYKHHSGKVRGEYAEIIKKESIRLSNLVDNFLDISKIEAGIMVNGQRDVNLKKIIDHFVKLFREEGKTHQISVDSDVEKDLPLVNGDKERLGQIFSNLLSNAIKFTPPKGSITVKASLLTIKKGEFDTQYVEVSVADTGIGIPSDSLEIIFDKFVQLNHHNISSSRGTGLGLTICKKIAEQHGGAIKVESKEGLGTKFTFTLKVLGKDTEKSLIAL